jgi:hypothetical protein
MDMTQHGVKYVGVFEPIEPIVTEMQKYAGSLCVFEYYWTNDDDESNYPGAACYSIVESHNADEGERIPALWVPECDIVWSKRPRVLADEETALL